MIRDCLVCHGPSVADRHHLLVEAGSWECMDCHQIVPDEATQQYVVEFKIACISQQLGEDWEAQHDQASVPYDDCAQCHAGNVVTEHVNNKGLLCSTCHESMSTAVQQTITSGTAGQPVYCKDCHMAYGNHAIQHEAALLTPTDCAGCHTDYTGNRVTEHELYGIYCFDCHAVEPIAGGTVIGPSAPCGSCHTPDHTYPANQPPDKRGDRKSFFRDWGCRKSGDRKSFSRD